MRTLRRLAPAVLALGLLASLPAGARGPGSTAGLTGVARDVAGEVLADVEVLLLPADSGSVPVARTRTDSMGRFIVPDLPEGLYRVAALKSGYLTALTRVHTSVRSSLEIVLDPIPKPGEPGAERVLEDRSWMLRVPKRSLLRDVDPVALLAESPDAPEPERSSSIPDTVQAEVMHRVAVAGIGGDSGVSALQGAETRMQVASLVGPGANLRFEGARESFSSRPDGKVDVGETRQRADAFAMNLSVEAGRHSNVDVRAFYQDADLAVAGGIEPSQRDTQRSWGYDATWATQLDAASRLAVQLDYVDLSVAPDAGRIAWNGSSNRAIGAETGYEVLADESHLIRFGFRAQRLDLALPLVRAGAAPTTFLGVTGAAGWSATLDVEDAWAVGGGTTVLYGVGVRQSIDEADSTLLVPRAGAAWSGRYLEVRGVVSYHTTRGGGTGEPGVVVLPGEIRLSDPLGFEAQLSAPLGGHWTASALYRDLPVEPAYLGLREAAPSEAYYLSNGNVADQRTTLQLDRPGTFGTFSLRWTGGRAEGFVADNLGWASPYQILAERVLRYRSAAAQMMFQRSGTGLTLEWVEIAEELPADASTGAGPGTSRRYLDAEFQQDLVRFGFLDARCRLVVAARVGAGSDNGDGEAERNAALLALQRRLSAGVAVVF